MAPSEFLTRLRALTMTLTTLQVEVSRCANELQSLLDLATSPAGYQSRPAEQTLQIRLGRYIVDRTTFSVTNGSRRCFLGNTVHFRLLEYVANQPNRCFTHSDLLAAVWDGQHRAGTTIRRAFFDLRKHLRDSGISDLADAIASEGRAYGLTFAERPR